MSLNRFVTERGGGDQPARSILRRSRYVVAAVIGASSAVAGPLGLSHAQVLAAPTGRVTSDVAKAAAVSFLRRETTGPIADLSTATAGQPSLELGVAPGDDAYSVPLYREGAQVGYAITGASYSQAPIMRVSHGSLQALAARNRAVAEAQKGQTAVSTTFLHMDQFTEVAAYAFADGSTLEADLSSGQVGHFGVVAGKPALSAAAASANAQDWQRLVPTTSPLSVALGGALTTAQADYLNIKTLNPYPNYEWYRGCSPTAGFMVEAYWSQHGKGNLMALADYAKANAYTGQSVAGTPTPGTKAYIDRLAGDMGTDGSGATYTSNIGPGLQTFSSQAGYAVTVYTTGNPAYSLLTHHIDTGHPDVGSFLSWYYYSPTGTLYNSGPRIDHSVSIHGYQWDQTNSYMYLRDDAVEDGDNLVKWDGQWSYSQLDSPWY